MSQQGFVAWYTNSSEIDLAELLVQLPGVVGFDRADFASRHKIVSRLDDPDWDSEIINEDLSGRDLRRLYIPNKVLYVEADFAELGSRVERGVRKHIPAEIRGDFMPNRPYLSVGPHFWSDSEHEELQTPYRAMVGCWGYSTPADGAAFKERIKNIPEVLDEKSRLERIMGPVQTACYFNF